MITIRVTGYKNYLRKLERSEDTKSGYTRIPKKILIDPHLSEKERVTWMVLASFLYTSDSNIFPGRKLLTKLLSLKYVQQVSKITKSLQKKGYLTKYYDNDNRITYELHFNIDVDESIFTKKTSYNSDLVPSRYNKI